MTAPNIVGVSVPRWQENEGRKRIRQLKDRIKEFSEQLKDAQAAILEHTEDIYVDRQKEFFAGTNSAIEHLNVILNYAEGGLTPRLRLGS